MNFAEACAIGHPDKVADQISDAILDAYLAQDPTARVDITCAISHDTLFLAGEITSSAQVDLGRIAKCVLVDIGYTSKEAGFDAASCKTILEITQQSSDIAKAVGNLKADDSKASDPKAGDPNAGDPKAGDQGIMIGYATDETPEFMPLACVLAHSLMKELHHKSEFGPDGKTLVGVSYNGLVPEAVAFIILSFQHPQKLSIDDVRAIGNQLILSNIPPKLINEKTQILVNPGGRFVIGGPSADTGITGRKLMCDTYGTAARHGGGAFSGKDPTKVDRSAAYMARYIAKNIVAAKLASRCEVSLNYAIGMPRPIAISINTFGTSSIPQDKLEAATQEIFDLSVSGIISILNLQRPIYRQTAWQGHFGHAAFTWEATNKTNELKKSI